MFSQTLRVIESCFNINLLYYEKVDQLFCLFFINLFLWRDYLLLLVPTLKPCVGYGILTATAQWTASTELIKVVVLLFPATELLCCCSQLLNSVQRKGCYRHDPQTGDTSKMFFALLIIHHQLYLAHVHYYKKSR